MPRLQIFAQGSDGGGTCLLHGESSDGEIDGRAFWRSSKASSMVAESLPPESATARVAIRIMR